MLILTKILLLLRFQKYSASDSVCMWERVSSETIPSTSYIVCAHYEWPRVPRVTHGNAYDMLSQMQKNSVTKVFP